MPFAELFVCRFKACDEAIIQVIFSLLRLLYSLLVLFVKTLFSPIVTVIVIK